MFLMCGVNKPNYPLRGLIHQRLAAVTAADITAIQTGYGIRLDALNAGRGQAADLACDGYSVVIEPFSRITEALQRVVEIDAPVGVQG